MVKLIGADSKRRRKLYREKIICLVVGLIGSFWIMILGVMGIFLFIFKGFMGYSSIEWIVFLIGFLVGGCYAMFILLWMWDKNTKKAIIKTLIMMLLAFGVVLMPLLIIGGLF